jgi:phosphoribulokinase
VRGDSAETVTDTILRRMPKDLGDILPQYAHTYVHFERLPVVGTSNPFNSGPSPRLTNAWRSSDSPVRKASTFPAC